MNARKYDGFRVLEIDGVSASDYLVDLAQQSSIYKGLIGAYESVEGRYMRLMSRYSADTTSGGYTQEVGRFASRTYYPGADSVTLVLMNGNGKNVTITVPWSAHFIGSGTDTPSFISQTCLTPTGSTGVVSNVAIPAVNTGSGAAKARGSRGVVEPDSQDAMREIADTFAKKNASVNYVKPNLVSYGPKVDTVDIYRLKKHPNVGVVYMEQFEPSDGTSSGAYFDGMSAALFQGLTELKAVGVDYLIIDQSGNRGGYIYAGAIAMWSFFPNDLYPGFPAQFRDLDLAKRQSNRAANQKDADSAYVSTT